MTAYLLGCLTGFIIGAGLTLWTLNRIGKRLQQRSKEAAAMEQTIQIIQKAYFEHLQKN